MSKCINAYNFVFKNFRSPINSLFSHKCLGIFNMICIRYCNIWECYLKYSPSKSLSVFLYHNIYLTLEKVSLDFNACSLYYFLRAFYSFSHVRMCSFPDLVVFLVGLGTMLDMFWRILGNQNPKAHLEQLTILFKDQ